MKYGAHRLPSGGLFEYIANDNYFERMHTVVVVKVSVGAFRLQTLLQSQRPSGAFSVIVHEIHNAILTKGGRPYGGMAVSQ